MLYVNKSTVRQILQPEIIAGLLIALFGLIFTGLIRPLGIPDEPNHFLRAYQVASGELYATNTTTTGCLLGGQSKKYGTNQLATTVPRSVEQYMSLDNVQHTEPFSIANQFKVKLDPSDTVRICVQQTQANSPVGYLPQALAIFILKPFNASPVLMDYAARLATLVTWTVLVVLAIKVIPVKKWTILGLALLPIAIQQSISIGADSLSIAPVVLFMAILIRSYYENREQYFRRDLISLGLLASVATLSKPVMVLLFLLPPFYYVATKARFTFRKYTLSKALVYRCLAMLLPIFGYMIWSSLAGDHKIGPGDIFYLESAKASLFKQAPLDSLRVFFTESWHYLFYGLSLDEFGAFGWFTYSIPQTWRYVGVAALLLTLLVGYPESSKPLNSLKLQRLRYLNTATLVVGLGIIFATMVTFYIIWTPLKAFGLEGIQFRYFLAPFFIIGCLVELRFLQASQRWYRNFVLINATLFFVISVLTLVKLLPTR